MSERSDDAFEDDVDEDGILDPELMPGSLGRWWPWFERGSWLVLIVGGGGVLARTYGFLAQLLRIDQGPFGVRVNVWPDRWETLLNMLGQVGFDLAKVLFFFLTLRLLMFGVTILLDLNRTVVIPDDEETME